MKYYLLASAVILSINLGFSQKNVGIGIDIPASRFHIHQDNLFSDPVSRIQLSNTATGPGVSDGLILSAILSDASLMNHENGHLHLGTNSTNRLSVLNNGKIGINTNTLIGSSDLTIRSYNSSSYGGMYIESPNDTGGRPFYGYATNGIGKMWHYFDAATQSWKVYLNGDRLTLLNSGKFGIGTSTPNQSLSVNGKIELGDDLVAATAGAMRWNGIDFEGFDGNSYKSFTHYLDRDEILGYEEYYNYSLCPDPDAVIIYDNTLSPSAKDCAVIYDTGGANSGYGNNENITYILTSQDYTSFARDYVIIIVEEVDLEPTKDSLIISFGDQTHSYSGLLTTPDTLIHKDEFLTIVSKSDGSNPQPYEGFKISVQFSNLDSLDASEGNQLLGYYFNPGNKSLAAGVNFDQEWKDSLGSNSMSFGIGARGWGEESIAVGTASIANNYNAIAIGLAAWSLDDYSIAIGYNSSSEDNFAISLGNTATAKENQSMALGSNALASCSDCSVISDGAYSNIDNSVIVGSSSIGTVGGYQNWSNLSDGRFKINVKENIPGLAFINGLRPVTYNFDIQKFQLFQGLGREPRAYEGIAGNEVRTGFIAQEVEALAQSIGYDFSGVFTPPDEDAHYSIRYAEFVVPLVKAVQELAEENITLKEQVEIFQEELQALKNIVYNQESNNPQF